MEFLPSDLKKYVREMGGLVNKLPLNKLIDIAHGIVRNFTDFSMNLPRNFRRIFAEISGVRDELSALQ